MPEMPEVSGAKKEVVASIVKAHAAKEWMNRKRNPAQHTYPKNLKANDRCKKYDHERETHFPSAKGNDP
jgi:hypothetical protein